jgi:hypothetical protein
METEDRVNSPSHYRADGQPECIVILEILVKRFKKIAALCFGQFKYLYRAGLKKEEGMTIDTKSREDVKKLVWYIKHIRYIFYKESGDIISLTEGPTLIPESVLSRYIDEHETTADFYKKQVIKAFQYGKDEKLKEHIENCISLVFNFTTFEELDEIIKELEYIAENI